MVHEVLKVISKKNPSNPMPGEKQSEDVEVTEAAQTEVSAI